MNKKKIIKWLKIILFIYFIGGIALYFFQEKILFHPVAIPQGQAYHFNTPFEELDVQEDSSTSFNIVKFKPVNDSAPKGVVIYCHGNMENNSHYAAFAPNFTKHNYEVWMMDYPGFGKSTGTISEDILYYEVLQVYKIARAKGFAPDSIIIYGKSIGTGIAAELASVRDCKRLILESPYSSIANLSEHLFFIYPVSFMLKYKIPTDEYFKKITAPITIFHGTDDGVVPFSNSEKLKALMKPGDELVPIEGGSHNNLNDFPLMKEKLDSVLSLP